MVIRTTAWAAALSLLTLPAVARAAQPPSPEALWHEIRTLDKAHSLMVGTKAFQPGSRTVDVYTVDLANSSANDAIRKAGGIVKTTRYPDGALVVKKNYDAHRKLTGVTAMLKLHGYDKDDRDWVMAAYNPAGKIVHYGKVQACISCHVMVLKQDTVFAPPPDQLLPTAVWAGFFPKQTMSPIYLRLLKEHPKAIVNG
jgi:hypothetical protein